MERAKFKIEFLFRASPTILYQFLTTPSWLVRWFCDSVDIQGDTYVFMWEETVQTAELIDDIEEELLRFRWEDAEVDSEYLEYKISKARVTDETVLEITDFCDDDEVDDQRRLWEAQIQRLHKAMGDGG